jgi:AbiV family abortive infection protein
MKTRAIKDLCQLNDPKLFQEISTGMDLATSNARMIEQDASALHDIKSNSYDILMAVACEEAAKTLLLLDAVRCPRQSPNFSRQLERFNDHFSKDIYAEMCDWEPSSKKDLRRYLDIERQEFYLDGPNDVDWIFPNRIRHARERNMYVDYVQSEEVHLWLDPFKHERIFSHYAPRVILIATSLQTTGCTHPTALSEIAAIWRPAVIDDSFSRQALRELNRRTLHQLEHLNLLDESDGRAIGMIVNYLPFPLHDTDLSLISVNTKDLKKRQQASTGA